MVITTQEFYQSLKETLALTAGVDGSSIESEFIRFGLDKLVDFGDIDEYELIEDGRDAADVWRIDAFSDDSESELSIGTISLFISLFDQASEPSNLIQTDIDRLLKKLKKYVEFSLEKDPFKFFEPGSGPFNVATTLKAAWTKAIKPKLRFYVISNRPISKRITDIESIEIHGLSVEVVVWDLNRFLQMELSGREREDIEIDLSDTPLKALMATTANEGALKSALVVMPAPVLVAIYGKWGGRLLEQNVRSFLSTKNSVNKGMRETITSAPDKFFAFNNGITGTAENAIFVAKNDGLYLTHLKNFQIVNGGQTTATLFSAAMKDKLDVSNIAVQMKLSIVSPEKANELVPYISKFANSQTKVNDSDLFSNHPFHQRFEEFSRRIIAPPKPGAVAGSYWFYERARGQYVNEQAYKTDAEKKKFQALNPRDQMLTKTELAKFLNTFEMLPNIVSKGAQYSFSEFAKRVTNSWDQSDSNISEGFFRSLIAKAIMFKRLEKLVQTKKEEWFIVSRANVVTYTLSLLSYIAKQSGKAIDFDLIWKKQSLPISIETALLKLSKRVNELLRDENRPIMELSSYAKSEAFWTVVKSEFKNINVSDFSEILIDKSEYIEQKRENKKSQKFSSDLEAELKVKGTLPTVWPKVLKYLQDNNMENPSRTALISKAQRTPLKLTDKECLSLFVVLEEYESFYRNK
jgi:hypothetical protein